MMIVMIVMIMLQVILGVYSKTRFSTNINLALANTKGVILAVRLALLVLHLIIVQVMMMMVMMIMIIRIILRVYLPPSFWTWTHSITTDLKVTC